MQNTHLGTLLVVSKRAGLLDSAGRIPWVERILLADSVATMGGALLGTSTVVSYIESAAGVAAEGQSASRRSSRGFSSLCLSC